MPLWHAKALMLTFTIDLKYALWSSDPVFWMEQEPVKALQIQEAFQQGVPFVIHTAPRKETRHGSISVQSRRHGRKRIVTVLLYADWDNPADLADTYGSIHNTSDEEQEQLEEAIGSLLDQLRRLAMHRAGAKAFDVAVYEDTVAAVVSDTFKVSNFEDLLIEVDKREELLIRLESTIGKDFECIVREYINVLRGLKPTFPPCMPTLPGVSPPLLLPPPKKR